ncbi:odorant receptor 2a-like [Musca vetustissima]|uniref:odorant receptor 2a-like n=1 Tax=Musca vetustissima TaxID=27455 RepID=UPI002AB76097|nr:odorant receptor 2a-like [Musca vetustissima]
MSKLFVNDINTWQAFKYHWMLWKLCGLQPPTPDSKWLKPYLAYAIIFNLTTLLFPLSLVLDLLLSQNLTEIFQNLYVTVTVVFSSIKFINVVLIRKKLLDVRFLLEHLDVRARTAEQRQELENGITMAHKCFMIFLRLYICAVITSQLVVYFSSERVLMYPSWLPWDWKASRGNFLFALLFQIYAVSAQLGQNLGNDTYPQAYIVILIAHIRALALRIQSLGILEGETPLEPISQEEYYRELSNCVKDHENVHDLYLTIQECLSTTCLAQFIATGLAQCIIGVYILYVGDDFSRLLNSSVFFCAVTIEILVLCYFGDLYCQANEFLIDSIYATNWMDRDGKFKKALLLVLHRAQMTNCLKAGNFIPVMLPTFVSIMKTAYSIFTVLNKFN